MALTSLRPGRLAGAALLALSTLGACQSAEEYAKVLAEERQAACQARGFDPGRQNFELCLMMQETRQRLEQVERRIDLLDSQIWRATTYTPCSSCR